MKETYEELLARAPKNHFSEEFKLFLINNNEVRFMSDKWLVIENCKYRTEENDWLTAFRIDSEFDWVSCERIYKDMSLDEVMHKFRDREFLIRAPHTRSIELFHVHLYKKVPDSTPSI